MSAPTSSSTLVTVERERRRRHGRTPATAAAPDFQATTEVVDYSFAVIPAQAIRDAGYAGTIRYLSPPPNEKNWTAEQVAEHRAAGLHLGFVWETTTGRPRAGYDAGVHDARRANDLCDELGVPAGVVVYYACDERELRIDEVDAYFQGVRDVGRRPRGVYGSKHILDNVIDRGYASYGWQVETWTDEWDGNRPVLSRHASIVQLPNRRPRVDGTDANVTLHDDWGQWHAPGSEPWTPRPIPEGARISEISSPNGRSVLVMQEDGNLVLYRDGQPRWASNTFGEGHVAQHQPDGNLVVYRPDGRPVWSSGTWGHPDSALAVQDDGNVVIYAGATGGGVTLWATGTEEPGPRPVPEGARISEIRSPEGRSVLVMQADGNLVLYFDGQPAWASNTFGEGYVAQHQPDGNLVVYRPDGRPVWDSGTWGRPGSRLAVQDDGSVVIYASAADGGAAVWATNGAGSGSSSTAEPGQLSVEQAREWIDLQNFRLGVAGFQEAWPGEDLAVDNDLGPRTLAAIETCIRQGGLLSANFHLSEFRCTHCGRCRVNRDLVRRLQAVRDHLGHPLGQWSSYRCEHHQIEAAKPNPGYHTLGMAFDPNPYLPRHYIDPHGFGGVGISHKYDPGKVSHVDVRGGYAEFPDN